jgi:mRNA-degrading endonuclease toxin of MazEF toxin-antitoxin module
VLVARRRLGFGAEGKAEHFVVLQSDDLPSDDVVIVAPLEATAPMYQRYPLAVPVTPKEAGTTRPHVVLPCLLAAASTERFEEVPAGKLSIASMSRIDGVLRLALHLP